MSSLSIRWLLNFYKAKILNYIELLAVKFNLSMCCMSEVMSSSLIINNFFPCTELKFSAIWEHLLKAYYVGSCILTEMNETRLGMKWR